MKLREFLFPVFALALSLSVVAQGKGRGGGGGSGDPVPLGDIYVFHRGDVLSMKADGSEQTVLLSELIERVEPSHLLHDGSRWFLEFRAIDGEFYPDGRQRYELFASGDAGQRVQLTDDSTLQAISPAQPTGPSPHIQEIELASPKWTFDDRSVGFVARRWGTDATTGQPALVEMGIFVIDLATDVDSLQSPGLPWRLDLDFPERVYEDYLWPDVLSFDWSPDAALVTYGSGTGVFVAQPGVGILSTLFTTEGSQPQWSPDGGKIAFVTGGYHYTVAPDGTELTALIDRGDFSSKRGGGGATQPYWSPDGEHLAFTRGSFRWRSGVGLIWTGDVYRIPRDGGAETSLGVDLTYGLVMGWR